MEGWKKLNVVFVVIWIMAASLALYGMHMENGSPLLAYAWIGGGTAVSGNIMMNMHRN